MTVFSECQLNFLLLFRMFACFFVSRMWNIRIGFWNFVFFGEFSLISATTRRVRHDRSTAGTSHNQNVGQTAADRSSRRKQSTSTSRRHHSIRRGSQFHEVHIAMLPDLSGEIIIVRKGSSFCFFIRSLLPLFFLFNK